MEQKWGRGGEKRYGQREGRVGEKATDLEAHHHVTLAPYLIYLCMYICYATTTHTLTPPHTLRWMTHSLKESRQQQSSLLSLGWCASR